MRWSLLSLKIKTRELYNHPLSSQRREFNSREPTKNYTPGTARFSRNFGKQRPYLLIVTAIHENDIFCRWKYPMVVFLSHCGFSSYGRSSNYSGGKLFLFSQIYQIMLTPIFSKFTIYPRQNTYSLPICFSTYLG